MNKLLYTIICWQCIKYLCENIQVNIGAENMNFDCGQFMFFGVQALIG